MRLGNSKSKYSFDYSCDNRKETIYYKEMCAIAVIQDPLL